MAPLTVCCSTACPIGAAAAVVVLERNTAQTDRDKRQTKRG